MKRTARPAFLLLFCVGIFYLSAISAVATDFSAVPAPVAEIPPAASGPILELSGPAWYVQGSEEGIAILCDPGAVLSAVSDQSDAYYAWVEAGKLRINTTHVGTVGVTLNAQVGGSTLSHKVSVWIRPDIDPNAYQNAASIREKILKMVSDEREARGLPPLRYDTMLEYAATQLAINYANDPPKSVLDTADWYGAFPDCGIMENWRKDYLMFSLKREGMKSLDSRIPKIEEGIFSTEILYTRIGIGMAEASVQDTFFEINHKYNKTQSGIIIVASD